MSFSVNQVRHLYVVKDVKNSTPTKKGDLQICSEIAGDNKSIYFKYMGAKGNLMRSDLIPLAIDGEKVKAYVKQISGDDSSQNHALKQCLVKLSDDALVDGKPVACQDYILRIVINPYIGMSNEEPYMKYGVVHTYTSDTTDTFYKKMAISLAKNFSRELDPMLKFYLADTNGAPGTEVKASDKVEDLTGTAYGIVIEETLQEWSLGIKPEVFVNYDVYPTTVIVEGDDIVWGTVKEQEGASIPNGRKIADLEYFCMGERGDVYRGIGFPYTIPTEYLVEPFDSNGNITKYDILEVHYAFTDEGISSYRSEKDIELVADDTTMEKIMEALNDYGLPHDMIA